MIDPRDDAENFIVDQMLDDVSGWVIRGQADELRGFLRQVGNFDSMSDGEVLEQAEGLGFTAGENDEEVAE